MKLLGIDLSMTSPALCFFEGVKFGFSGCEFYFLTSYEKHLYRDKKLHGEMFPSYSVESERFGNIGSWVVDVCKVRGVEKVYIEGYSYGSKGRVFEIAENGGICKYLLWRNGIDYEVVAPTLIKKFATGKGNATKEGMGISFMLETNFDIKSTLGMTEKQWNPSSDLVDSYYVCKYGVYNECRSG
jgi:hypothetical protein